MGDSPHDRIIATHCPINSTRNLCYCLDVVSHIYFHLLEMSEYPNSFDELTFFISFTKFIFGAIAVSSASRDTLFKFGVCFWTNVSEILQNQILVNIIDQSLQV